jgi:hypothetical protein
MSKTRINFFLLFTSNLKAFTSSGFSLNGVIFVQKSPLVGLKESRANISQCQTNTDMHGYNEFTFITN